MRNKRLLTFILLFSISVFSQIKGKVVDTFNKPISYVNISVENENIGTTSEENGEFIIRISDKTKNLIFSAIGFEKRIIKAVDVSEVVMKQSETELKEVVIVKKFGTKIIEIGKTENGIYQAFDNGPRIDTKFFPYFSKYKKTKFIKQVTIQTDCKIENASFKLHFYAVDSQGFPSTELLTKDFIVSVEKGVKKTFFNINDLNLQMPKNGIFVGFEKLLIEKNKTEKTTFDSNSNTTKTQISFDPFVLYNSVERDFLYTFSGGKWINKNENKNTKIRIYEPAINLILTN
jgi:CarboxypepD_reg-like domain